MDLSIVLPAWNEAENLKALIPALRGALAGVVEEYEIVVVDGGSKDGTAEVARELGCVAFRQTTPGYGGALREGFKAARGRFLCTLDADLSHPPTFIAEMWRRREEAELVVASRYVPGGKAEMPRTREVLSKVLNRTFGELLSIPVKDLSSGFRLYRREALERFETRGTNFNVLQELLTGVLVRGGRVVEVPFHYMPRIHGVSHARIIRFGISYLGSLWHLFFVRTALFRGEPALRRSPYLLVIVLAVFAAYAGSLGNGWVHWDDDYLVFENPALRRLDAPALAAIFDPRGPAEAAAGCSYCGGEHTRRYHYGSQYTPLADLSYAIDGAVFGWKDARPFHVQGVLWHALAACLLFLLVNRHLRAAGLALTAALLFALHPVATESVTWVSGRRTAMCLAFVLASALAWSRARERRDAVAYAASLVALALACLSKQYAVAAPIVLVAMELTALEEGPEPRPRPISPLAIAALAPHALLAAASAWVALDVGRREGIVGAFPGGPAMQAKAALIAVASYGSMLAWPTSLRPSYSLSFSSAGELDAIIGAGAVILGAAILGTCVALVRARRGAGAGARACAFAGAGALGLLAPSLAAVGTQILGERYAYATLAFAAVAASAVVARLALVGPPPSERAQEEAIVRRRRAVAFGLAALLVAMGVGTHLRNRAWANDVALWADAAAKDPASNVAHRYLGEALARRKGPGDLERAEAELMRAFELEQAAPAMRGASPLPVIAGELARLIDDRGDHPLAESLLRSVARKLPDSEIAALELAGLLARRGERARAREGLEAFLRRHPEARLARARLDALADEPGGR